MDFSWAFVTFKDIRGCFLFTRGGGGRWYKYGGVTKLYSLLLRDYKIQPDCEGGGGGGLSTFIIGFSSNIFF